MVYREVLLSSLKVVLTQVHHLLPGILLVERSVCSVLSIVTFGKMPKVHLSLEVLFKVLIIFQTPFFLKKKFISYFSHMPFLPIITFFSNFLKINQT